jgi:hypothetical protein
MAKKEVKGIDLKAIKALSKEQRQKLALTIRRDSELWNAVNGFGGLSEFSSKSRLQGTVIEDGKASVGTRVKIVNDDTSKEFAAVTNQQGYYSIELEPAEYTVSLKSSGTNSKALGEEVSVETLQGETSTLDFDESSDSSVL